MYKILIIVILLVLIVLGWSPWLSNDDARKIVKTYNSFQLTHKSGAITEVTDEQIGVTWFPFCRWVTTYEGGWLVCFWEKPQ